MDLFRRATPAAASPGPYRSRSPESTVPRHLDLLAEASLNLSTARPLAPHLRPDNFETLVAQARGRGKREVEVLVARLSPRPDVASSVRQLPARAQTVPVLAPSRPAASVMAPGLALESEAGANLPPPAAPDSRILPPEIAAGPERPTHRPAITSLAPERYRVQFTVGGATREKLAQSPGAPAPRAPGWRSWRRPSSGPRALLQEVARKKLAVAARPRHRSRQDFKDPAQHATTLATSRCRPRGAPPGEERVPEHVSPSI